MPISAQNIIVSEAASRTPSVGTRAYFQARTRMRLYDLVMTSFRKAADEEGLTKAELARRTGKQPAVLTRILSGPTNWTVDTISDLLICINGEELDATSSPPFTEPCRNSNYSSYDFFGRLEQIMPSKQDGPAFRDAYDYIPFGGNQGFGQNTSGQPDFSKVLCNASY